ncbi:MAG: methyltransferase type 11 [Acidocella sp. 20-63-7]|nr:MAG: methyltransferase type 11 [Acidocella sp. 20-63-7]HQT46634.1 methyltransferase domain-containing protein [Acidocella sp.]
MAVDARDTAEFYATPLGRLTTSLLRRKLLGLWPDCANLSILGLGYTGPYLHLWREQAQRSIALSPPQLGLAPWPLGRPSLACAAEEDALPFPDLSFDRILLVHGLEQAENARRTLREAWRLLKDDGRLIVVVPNRRGLWAYAESTPFGHGQPYSQGQLARLLSSLFFQVEDQDSALFAPPLDWPPLLRAFNALERLGNAMLPRFSGLTLAQASKDMHGIIPVGQRAKGRRVLVDAGR